MQKILFIANIHSPHIHEWLELLDEDTTLRFATIEAGVFSPEGLRCKFDGCISMPSWSYRLPKVIRYALLGLRLRLLRQEDLIFHAHNSSGYGLSALLSGKPFILTTYGSEIFRAKDRSPIYQLLLRQIIKRSHSITASSQSMATFLLSQYAVKKRQVSFFSLGVKSAFLRKPTSRVRSRTDEGRVWISNRRMHPLYHITEIVEAFGAFKERGGEGSLIVLTGDADGRYSETVRSAASGIGGLRIVDGFVDAPSLATLLVEADFSISIPDSDQLSSSILESMACECVPIIRPLASYVSVQSVCLPITDVGNLQENLLAMFLRTSRMSDEEVASLASAGQALVLNEYSKASAKEKYDAILEMYQMEELS